MLQLTLAFGRLVLGLVMFTAVVFCLGVCIDALLQGYRELFQSEEA